ncbi:hypothetical protein [Anoxynatronum sibiricum]|uniref:Uncharacterized protein n=1 Tax=Anoxynatronum sibiricum TaxID=210623 RepID=A0ABU9VTN3_9CLOT
MKQCLKAISLALVFLLFSTVLVCANPLELKFSEFNSELWYPPENMYEIIDKSKGLASQNSLDHHLEITQYADFFKSLRKDLDSVQSYLWIQRRLYPEDISITERFDQITELNSEVNVQIGNFISVFTGTVHEKTMEILFEDDFDFYSSDSEVKEIHQNFKEEIEQLKRKYEESLAFQATVEFEGEIYDAVTFDEVWSDPESPDRDWDAFYEVLAEIGRLENQHIGEVIVEAIHLRNTFAQSLGHENYAVYHYHSQDLDYTPEELDRVLKAVKDDLVPLFNQLQKKLAVVRQSPELTAGIPEKLDREEYLELVINTLEESPLLDIFNEALERELILFSDNPSANWLAFAAQVERYNAPITYISEVMNPTLNFKLIMHEFGHHANIYHDLHQGLENPDHKTLSFDEALAEFHGLGLEFLSSQKYPELFPDFHLFAELEYFENILYHIILASLNYDFQMSFYRLDSDNATYESIDHLYGELHEAYGLKPVDYYDWPKDWLIMESPLRTTEYVLPALAIFGILSNDPELQDEAWHQYWESTLLAYPYTFRKGMEKVGVSDIFLENQASMNVKNLEQYLTERGVFDQHEAGR